MLDTQISNFIESQFPEIYREEGPFFVEFVKQYYNWLETDTLSPVYQARHHLSNHDIDTTVSDFILYFKEKYLKNIQLNTATDTQRLVKNALDLYRSKGSENSIKLFFDLIFSAEAEIYYPGNDIFKLSSSEWFIPYYLEIITTSVNRLLVGQIIKGVNSGATAFVEKLVRRKSGATFMELLYVSAISGTFETGEIITLQNNSTTPLDEFPTMIGSLTDLTVIGGGSGFQKGDIVNLESRTGSEAKGLVTDLQSVTGTVSFYLNDGGWGYTINSDMYVSEKVLSLSNVHIVSSTNTSLDGKLTHVYQPMANVQWYNNTAIFTTGETVYNYYANGTLIGVNTILSAEYGTNTTTNYFLLNTISGNNYMDGTAPYYYTAGNTASFQVQNAGWTDNTAEADVIGISSNVMIYCTGNSALFSVGDIAYQRSSNNQVFVTSGVQSVTKKQSNSFILEVDNLEGMFLTNQPLISTVTSGNVTINSISYDIGLRLITGAFNTANGNILFDTSNNSLWNASATKLSFGDGANTSFDSNLLYPETVEINTNYVRDHIDETNGENWINATSYGADLNLANLTNMTLADALRFQTMTLGMIATLKDQNPGSGYSYAPFVEAIDPLVAPLSLFDFVIRLESPTGIFTIGEEITQSINGAKGLVKFANTSEVHVRRLTFENNWTVGDSSNSYLMVGISSGHTAYPIEVTSDLVGIAGDNANITTNVSSSSSSVSTLKVTDSGFLFKDGDTVTFTSLDGNRSGTAIASVQTLGHGTGFNKTTGGFLSTNKYLFDGDYYQNFSYEIRSPVTVESYSDMLKNVLHVSGTKVFSSLVKNSLVPSSASVISSTVIENTVSEPLAVSDFENGVYTTSGNTVAFSDQWVSNSTNWFSWDPSYLVSGTGIVFNAIHFIGLLATSALKSVIGSEFICVAEYSKIAPDGHFFISLANDFTFDPEQQWDDDGGYRFEFYGYSNGLDTGGMVLPAFFGDTKAAMLFSSNTLAMSINGSDAKSIYTPTPVNGSVLGFGMGAGYPDTNSGGVTLKKLTFYSTTNINVLSLLSN
jgi:hypothetical protein